MNSWYIPKDSSHILLPPLNPIHTMKTSQTITIVALSVVATLSIAAVSGLQINNITAEEVNKKDYTFAEDTTVTAVMNYRAGGSEVIPFEVFNQVKGYDPTVNAVFTLEKVVGATPLLHKVSDESRKLMLTGSFMDRELLDVEVLVSRGGDVIRSFDYSDCRITEHGIETNHDSDDGWHNTSGFSIADKYEFTCYGYKPSSPIYDSMGKDTRTAKTTSSLDLPDTSTWNDAMKPKN